MGRAPSGVQGHSLVRGKAPEAESFEAFAHLKKAQKLLSICQVLPSKGRGSATLVNAYGHPCCY